MNLTQMSETNCCACSVFDQCFLICCLPNFLCADCVLDQNVLSEDHVCSGCDRGMEGFYNILLNAAHEYLQEMRKMECPSISNFKSANLRRQMDLMDQQILNQQRRQQQNLATTGNLYNHQKAISTNWAPFENDPSNFHSHPIHINGQKNEMELIDYNNHMNYSNPQQLNNYNLNTQNRCNNRTNEEMTPFPSNFKNTGNQSNKRSNNFLPVNQSYQEQFYQQPQQSRSISLLRKTLPSSQNSQKRNNNYNYNQFDNSYESQNQRRPQQSSKSQLMIEPQEKRPQSQRPRLQQILQSQMKSQKKSQPKKMIQSQLETQQQIRPLTIAQIERNLFNGRRLDYGRVQFTPAPIKFGNIEGNEFTMRNGKMSDQNDFTPYFGQNNFTPYFGSKQQEMNLGYQSNVMKIIQQKDEEKRRRMQPFYIVEEQQ